MSCQVQWHTIKTDTKTVFDKIFRTIWLHYKFLYNLLPAGRFLFQRWLVDSPVCVFCKGAEGTLLHMFWDCPKIQDYWLDVQGWLQTKFTHCTDIIFPKELVSFVSKVKMVTDRILDLCILIAKYNSFTSKMHGTSPRLNAFIRYLKSMYSCFTEILFFSKWQDPIHLMLTRCCAAHEFTSLVFTRLCY